MSAANAIERIRAQRERIRSQATLTLRVPGYDDLAVRYRLMSEAETEKIARKIEQAAKSRSAPRNVQAMADFLITACDAVMVTGEEGALDVLVDDEGAPVKLDGRLAEMLGIEAETARDIVLETFSPKGEDGLRRNPDAMLEHVLAIIDWRKGREHEIDRDLLGE